MPVHSRYEFPVKTKNVKKNSQTDKTAVTMKLDRGRNICGYTRLEKLVHKSDNVDCTKLRPLTYHREKPISPLDITLVSRWEQLKVGVQFGTKLLDVAFYGTLFGNFTSLYFG
jgi:hypothetical protein